MTSNLGQNVLRLLKEEHPDAECELNYHTPFELLVAVILSAQCTDKRVNLATERLFKVYSTPKDFAALTVEQLKPYIFSCGFYNNKGKNIIECARQLVARHAGEVPQTLAELTALAGVGRKTASVVLMEVFHIPAMPVDTHVFRLSHRLGLSTATSVEKVEQDLMCLFDPKDWHALHHALIFHGRYVCFARRPSCADCRLKEYCLEYQTLQKG